MAKSVGEFGLQHKPQELVAVFEYNLEELYDLQDRYPWSDGARRDVQDAIDAVEKRQKARDEARGPGLRVVLCEDGDFPAPNPFSHGRCEIAERLREVRNERPS